MEATPVIRFRASAGFDKRGNGVHPRRTMTTAIPRAAALFGLILFVVILILP
jgi:hypothetical protein